MSDLLTRLPLTRFPTPGHYGADGEGVCVRILDQYALATVSAARHQTPAVTEACKAHFGIALIDRPCVSDGDLVSFLGIGPGRWLAIAQSEQLTSTLMNAFGGSASVCDQSDGYVLFAAEGPAVRSCLAKGPPVDFSPSVFIPGTVATTSMAHIGLIIWQPRTADGFRIAVPSSFAPSFLRLLLANAAEFGIHLA